MNQDSYKPAFTYECQLDAKDIKVDAIRGLTSQELYFFLEWWFKNQNCSKILRESLKTRRITSHFRSWVLWGFFSRTFLLGKKRESNRAKNQKKWGREKTSRPTSDRCLDSWAVEFRWNCRQGQQPRTTRRDLAGAVDLGCSLIYSGESLPLKVQWERNKARTKPLPASVVYLNIHVKSVPGSGCRNATL